MPKITAPLTDAKLRNLKPRDKVYEVSDGGNPGLKVEVQPSGAKIWRFRYVLNGRREKLTIGEVGLADARERYREARELVSKGLSPATEKQREKARNADTEATVRGFFDHRYVPDHLSKLRSCEKVKQLFARDVLPSLGKLRLESVTPDDVEPILDRLKKAGHEASAVLVRAWMSSLFELAVDRRRIASNPVAQIKRKRVGKPAKRGRKMIEPELHAYVQALRTPIPSASAKVRHALELILLTACRRSELVKAQWSEIDLEAGVWRVPPANQKRPLLDESGHEIDFRVFLSWRAVEVLKELQKIGNGSPWVLPAERDESKHLHAEVLNATRGRLVRDTPALQELPHFTTHDGRRAFSSWAHEQLEHPDVVETCLGHTIPGVRGVYARPQFDAARRKLMEAWADHLHIAGADNVIPIRAA